MTATIRGATASTPIPTGAKLRLVFGETYAILNDDVFADKFADVWNQLPPRASLFPVARNSAYAGQTATTVDVSNHTARNMGEIVSSVEALTGAFVELRSVELLSGAAAAAITTEAGAAARDDAAGKSAAQKDADNPLSKFYHGLGDVAQKVFIVVLIVGALVALTYAGKLRKELTA